MGLKGYRLWAMGQLDSTLQSPTPCPPGAPACKSNTGFHPACVKVVWREGCEVGQ
jgi:hypothetical protein